MLDSSFSSDCSSSIFIPLSSWSLWLLYSKSFLYYKPNLKIGDYTCSSSCSLRLSGIDSVYRQFISERLPVLGLLCPIDECPLRYDEFSFLLLLSVLFWGGAGTLGALSDSLLVFIFKLAWPRSPKLICILYLRRAPLLLSQLANLLSWLLYSSTPSLIYMLLLLKM